MKKSTLSRTALFLAALIWGSSFVFVKNAVDVVAPSQLLAMRFTIGCLLLSVLFRKRLKIIDKDYIISGGIIGVCLFLAYFIQTVGITDTTPGKNAFLTAIYCVMVPFLFWFLGKTKPDRYNISAALICIMGIGFVSLGDDFSIGFGDALTLVGGFLYAVHLIAITILSKDKDPIVITILQFAVTAVISWIVALFEGNMVWALPADAIGEIVFLGVMPTAGALLLQNIGQKNTNPSVAAIILSLESVFGVLFSMLLYGEELTFKIAVGFVLIFAAVIISETKLSFLKGKFER